MTIPDSVIQQAATTFLDEYTTYGDGMLESGEAGIRAALPILRDAIRAELVEEMWRASNSKGANVYESGMIRRITIDQHWQLVSEFIKSFDPESETTT